jgi:hypothetical protein
LQSTNRTFVASYLTDSTVESVFAQIWKLFPQTYTLHHINIEGLHVKRVVFNEFAARFDVFARQRSGDGFGLPLSPDIGASHLWTQGNVNLMLIVKTF